MQPADMLWLAEKMDFDDNEPTYILNYLPDAAYSLMDVGFEIAFSTNNQEFHILSKSAVLLFFFVFVQNWWSSNLVSGNLGIGMWASGYSSGGRSATG